MNLNKSTLLIALASTLCTGASQAVIIDMDYSGLFTAVSASNNILQNTSYPYFADTTWGYGKRTQISGTLQIDTDTGAGSATVNPFNFYDRGGLITSGIELEFIGGTLVLGNISWDWGGNRVATQIVLDASGLFGAIAGGASVGDTIDQSSCAALPCTTPASNDIGNGFYPVNIGPALISTTSYNTTGQNGYLTTIDMLSLGTDDGIGGSPMDNGPFEDFNFNYDLTNITITGISDPSAVPLPAAVWLFGFGIIALAGIARRRKS